MHRRHVRHHPNYKCPPPGQDGSQSHYHGKIDIHSQVKDKNGNAYTVTQLGTIDEPVMEQATDLEMVSIPGTVKTIYSRSFMGCIRLISVKLNEGLKEIEELSFMYCTSLVHLFIPDSVESIDNAFMCCDNLQQIVIGKGMRRMKGAFKKCPNIYNVTCWAEIPPEVDEETFENNVFHSTSTLIVPYGSVLLVPYKSLDLYKNHRIWGKFRNIQEIPDTIPESVQRERMFHRMKDGIRYKIDEVKLMYGHKEASVVELEGGQRYSQKEVVIPIQVDDFKVVGIGDNAFRFAETTTIKLPSTITRIGSNAFTGSRLSSISLSRELTVIEDAAFQGCPLREINVPGSVKSIGNYAFGGCDQLKVVTLNSGLQKIGIGAFSGLVSLNSQMLTIPETVTEIGDKAFESMIAGIICLAENPPKIGPTTFNPVLWQSNIRLMVPYNSIQKYREAPYWRYFLDTVYIEGTKPVEVPKNGDTFEYKGIYYVVKDAKARHAHVTSLPGHRKYAGNLVIHNSVTYLNQGLLVKGIDDINYNAYLHDHGTNTELTGLSIPNGNSVTSIGAHALINVVNLQSFVIPNKVTSIGEGLFEGCSSLERISIGSGVNTIPANCFKGTALAGLVGKTDKKMTLHGNIKRIESGAFMSCKFIEIEIHDSVEFIGGSAFCNCQSLINVYMGTGMKEIGGSVFEGCTALKRVLCPAMTPPKILDNTFGQEIYENVTLYVHQNALAAYQADKNWKKFKNIVTTDGSSVVFPTSNNSIARPSGGSGRHPGTGGIKRPKK